MSASASKKKRKELEEQGLSLRALAEKKAKEQKTKLIKKIMVGVLIAAVIVAAVLTVVHLVNGPSYNLSVPAATVGEEKISVPVYDYFYNLTASNMYNSYSFLFDTSKKLSEQSSFFGEGTLEDFMKETTNSSLQEVFNVYAKAKADGYELTDEQKENIETGLENVKSEASTYGFASTDKYLAARFGEGADLDSYEEYLRIYMTYIGYATQLNENFNPSAEEIQAAYDKDPNTYDLVSYTYATSAAKSSPVASEEPADEENSESEDTTQPTETEYTDEAKAEAKAQAEAYLKELPEDTTSYTHNKSNAASYTTEEISDWLFDAERKEGDMAVFAKDDKNTFYYTVRFDGRDTNEYKLVNANVISITKDKEDAEIKEGEQTAKEKYDALLAAVKDGMSTEEFSTAVKALDYSDATSSLTHSYYIDEIRDFAYAADRKAGDLFQFENDTTYFLVRYDSLDKMTYRDTMVKNDLWTEAYNAIKDANEIVVNEDQLKYAFTDLSFSSNSSSDSSAS